MSPRAALQTGWADILAGQGPPSARREGASAVLRASSPQTGLARWAGESTVGGRDSGPALVGTERDVGEKKQLGNGIN